MVDSKLGGEAMATIERGHRTRERLLDIAERAVLEKGVGATSIEEIVAAAEITRGGFFYHFKSKHALAHALLRRHIDLECRMQDQIMDWAFRRTDDPLQACLIGLEMLANYHASSRSAHYGRLLATICYHECMFDREIRELYREAASSWRMRYLGLLNQISSRYRPRDSICIEHLADSLPAIADGAAMLSRVRADPKILPQQILIARSYLKLLFSPDRAA